jgi:hypothetical protein
MATLMRLTSLLTAIWCLSCAESEQAMVIAVRGGGIGLPEAISLAGDRAVGQEPPVIPHVAELVAEGAEFGRPSSIRAGAAGRVYASFPEEGVFRVFDPATGSLVVRPYPTSG